MFYITAILSFLISFSALPKEAHELEKRQINREELQKQYLKGQIAGSANLHSLNQNGKNVYFLYGAEHLKLQNYYFDFPVVYNKAVKKWINYFLSRGKNFFVRYSQRAGRYAPLLGKILDDHGLPRDLIFLAMAESGFQNNAKSWARAVGPWQFMPYTGKRFGLKIDWYVDERRDPIKATIAAARYLKKLYGDFGSWEIAAAAYNAGEGKLSRAIKRYKTENFWKIRKGRYLKAETKNYVPKIMALAIIGKNLSSFGFKDIDFHEPLDFDEVDIPANTDLYLVSDELDVDFNEIRRLNPELMRWITPPGKQSYKLRVPVGRLAVWNGCCRNRKADFLAKDFQTYKVRHGASLSAVAKKFKVKTHVLANLNNVSKNKRFRKGQLVKLPFRVGQSKKHAMYSDLYERPRRGLSKWRTYKRTVAKARKRGRKISSPSQFYTVRKGDTLWTVSRKFGVSLDTLIASNYDLVKRRMIRVGDKLVVK